MKMTTTKSDAKSPKSIGYKKAADLAAHLNGLREKCRGFRRVGEEVHEEIVLDTPNGSVHTHVFKQWTDVDLFIETYDGKLVDALGPKALCAFVYLNMSTLVKDPCLHAYKNGFYLTNANMFIPRTDPCLNEVIPRDGPAACKYHDQVFDHKLFDSLMSTNGGGPMAIPTPVFDKILDDQKLSKERKQQFMEMAGRLGFARGKFDTSRKEMAIIGPVGIEKVILTQLICDMFCAEDVQPIYTHIKVPQWKDDDSKFMNIAWDWGANSKFNVAEHTNSPNHTLFVGDKLPKDLTSAERNMLEVFEFRHRVTSVNKNRDGGLKKEWSRIHMKIVSAYHQKRAMELLETKAVHEHETRAKSTRAKVVSLKVYKLCADMVKPRVMDTQLCDTQKRAMELLEIKAVHEHETRIAKKMDLVFNC